MSKHRESVSVDVPPDIAERACRSAISRLGWRVLEDGHRRIVVKEVTPQVTSLTWSAKVELVVEESAGGSRINARGSITGLGPIQKNHLKGQVGSLLNNIEVVLQEGAPAASSGAGDISGELARLAELRDQDVLSETEFMQAKAHLFGE